ncbi:MAG: hypothetical protein HC831_09955 [Chloroflexia bacterium]|nr:hypothetical protein [Chloroflexia bacterium]
MKVTTIVIILLLFSFPVIAQDLTQDNDFFIGKIPEYKEWLKNQTWER